MEDAILKEFIHQYIKENLTVQVDTDSETDYGNSYKTVSVKLWLGSECISEDSSSISFRE